MTSPYRIATLFLVFLFAALSAFAAEPTIDKTFSSGATPPERGIDKARRSAMLECPAGSGAYCPISADCLCIGKECMCIKPEPRDGKNSTETQDIYNECKSNCRSTFDSQLGACNMHDWDPLGSEYKGCVKGADQNYSTCLTRCKDILR